jgi:hypothetical protein
MTRLRVLAAAVLVALLASAATLAAQPTWRHAAGVRSNDGVVVEFELWQRPGTVIYREMRGGELTLERRCDGATYQSFHVALAHRVVRSGFDREDCVAWATGHRDGQPPGDGSRPEFRPSEPPPPLDTDGWTVETYRALSAAAASTTLGMEPLPDPIGRFRFETAFEYTSARGRTDTYAIWSDGPHRDLQVVAVGRRMSIVAPDAAAMAAARAALRRDGQSAGTIR